MSSSIVYGNSHIKRYKSMVYVLVFGLWFSSVESRVCLRILRVRSYNTELLVCIECLLIFMSVLTFIDISNTCSHNADTTFLVCTRHVVVSVSHQSFLSRRMWSSTLYRFPKTMCRHLFYWIIVDCHRL